jgi:hypothetical protein
MSTNTAKAARLATLTAELDAPESADARPIGQQRLDAARAAVAHLDAHKPTEAASAAAVVKPGDVVHVLESGMTIPRTTSLWGGAPALQLTRGDVFTVTAEMIEASRDRNGRVTWPAMVHDEAAQVRRWGTVRLRPGNAPEGMQPWTYGSPDWAEARETARRAAWAEPNPERRAEALQHVTEVYGAAPTTSTTLNTARTPSEREAEVQAERIRVAAANGTLNTGPSRGGE